MSPARMQVLHVIDSLQRGGIEKWLLWMTEELQSSAVQMTFFCKGGYAGPLEREARRLGVEVYIADFKKSPISTLRLLRALVRSKRFNVINIHVQVHSGVFLAALTGTSTVRVTSFHNTSFAPTKRRLNWLGSKMLAGYTAMNLFVARHLSDHITGCSAAVLDAVGANKGPASASVLYYGIPWSTAGRQVKDTRAEFGISDTSFMILHVGRFVDQKNQLGVVEIFNTVRATINSAVLMFVGAGPMQNEVKARVDALGLRTSVWFAGERDDVHELMRAADLFLLPSKHEGFGIVAIEAVYAETVVVCSHIPGLREAVGFDESAFLYPPDAYGPMAAKISDLAMNKALRGKITSRACANAQARFSSSLGAMRLHSLYKDVLSVRPGKRFTHHHSDHDTCTTDR